ncbi:PDR/VanB family oxidoreductase [Burkholderia seminalis]|uniref:PDR/VanB family oxidoreductase n=1 Tax=Burkholderia seminalis TaxID=488731 RepID=UPI00158EFB71|nr:PDR/VanB family oxidoreductase [Burkholderia seminalis]
MKVIIDSRTGIAREICHLTFRSTDGSDLPPFTPGSHIDLHLPSGLVRQYSLCGDPRDLRQYDIAVLREAHSRGGSTEAHTLQPGSVIEIGEPRNLFSLASDAKHSILLAGGIGITPLLSMATHLSTIHASYELHYCVRDSARAAFLDRLSRQPYASHTTIYVDNDERSENADFEAILARPDASTHLYACGPDGFITAAMATARSQGWQETNIHREFFAVADPGGSNSYFQINLARSNRIVDVPADQTALVALANAGVEIPSSCEQGVCGTCLTRVLAGEPDHRDMYLSESEQAANDCFLPCCSRAKSAILVLDL